MMLWLNTGPLQPIYWCLICLNHFRQGVVLHWLHTYVGAIHINHHHQLLVAMARLCWEMSCLIGVDVFLHLIVELIHLCENVFHLFIWSWLADLLLIYRR